MQVLQLATDHLNCATAYHTLVSVERLSASVTIKKAVRNTEYHLTYFMIKQKVSVTWPIIASAFPLLALENDVSLFLYIRLT